MWQWYAAEYAAILPQDHASINVTRGSGMSRSSKLKRVYSLPFEGPPPNALFASSLKPPGKPQFCWRITKRPSIPDQAISIIKELKNKQQFPVVVKTPVGPPATHRITQPSSTPFKDVTSDYYTGSHSDSSAVQHSDSFNVTKESADESISMSLKKLDLDENATADGSISCHNEGESSMLSAVSGFEEEDRMSPLDTIDEKEIEDSREIPSKEMRKHTQYAKEKWKKETRVLSGVKEGARDVMPPLEDGKNVKEKQMPPLEDRLGGRSPKSRKALLLENYNEIKEEEKRMNGKSRVTDFCPSSQLKENVLETKTSESQAPATLSMLPPVKPTQQSPLKNDQELRTEHSSTVSTPTSIKSASRQSSTFSTPTSINCAYGQSSTVSTPSSIKCASGQSSTFNTPTSNKSIRKLKLAASFCGAKNTVDNSKRHPSTCPAVLRSRSAIPKDTQLSVDASTSQLVSSSQQQSDTSTCVLQEQIRSMEQKIGAMENELSELLSNSEEDLPLWDEERLTTLDQFIQLKIKSGMKARFVQQRSAELSKYKQHFTSSESDLKLKHSTLQTEERALRTVLQLYYT